MPRVCRNFIREQACGIFHDPVHVSDELVDDVYQMLSDRHYRRFLLRVAMATRDQNMLDDLAKVSVVANVNHQAFGELFSGRHETTRLGRRPSIAIAV